MAELAVGPSSSDGRLVLAGLVIAALLFGAGVKVGWAWRTGDFQVKAAALQSKALLRATQAKQRLESDVSAARAQASAAEGKAAEADARAADAAARVAQSVRAATGCRLDPAEIDALNLVIEGVR